MQAFKIKKVDKKITGCQQEQANHHVLVCLTFGRPTCSFWGQRGRLFVPSSR